MTRAEQLIAIERMFADPMTAETCPECGGAVVERTVVGRCLYLWPCGDRAGQIGVDGRMLTLSVSVMP